MKRIGIWFAYLTMALGLILGSAIGVHTAVQQLAGLAVAQGDPPAWRNVQDAGRNGATALTSGVAAMQPYLYNGTDNVPWRGTALGGAFMEITGITGGFADGDANVATKLPVLICVADTDALATRTDGTMVPCITDLNGRVVVGVRGVAGSILSQLATYAKQGFTLFNTNTTGAANTAVVATIPAATNQTGGVHRLDAWCSAGTATLQIQNGATVIWQTNGAEVTTARFVEKWDTPLTGSDNTAMTITLGACGAGNTGTLIVQGSRL